jgi:outer membrane protein assembly factor BamE (lipoprotein component of BamABCDE complex)
MRTLPTLILIASAALSTACQTAPDRAFEKVQVGMTKGVVLEAAGNPTFSRRWKGRDRWIYVYKNRTEGPLTREVQFENGKSVYVGDEIAAASDPAEQDRLNQRAVCDNPKNWKSCNQLRDVETQIVKPANVGAVPSKELSPEQEALFNESMYGIPSGIPSKQQKFEEVK